MWTCALFIFNACRKVPGSVHSKAHNASVSNRLIPTLCVCLSLRRFKDEQETQFECKAKGHFEKCTAIVFHIAAPCTFNSFQRSLVTIYFHFQATTCSSFKVFEAKNRRHNNPEKSVLFKATTTTAAKNHSMQLHIHRHQCIYRAVIRVHSFFSIPPSSPLPPPSPSAAVIVFVFVSPNSTHKR